MAVDLWDLYLGSEEVVGMFELEDGEGRPIVGIEVRKGNLVRCRFLYEEDDPRSEIYKLLHSVPDSEP